LSMPRRLLGLAALVGAALLIMPVGFGFGADDPGASIPAPGSVTVAAKPPASPEAAASRGPLPARAESLGVSADLKAVANQFMAADTSLAAMLQGASYTVVKEGPWTRVKNGQQIGVVRELKLSRAVNAPMRGWPVIVWDEANDTYKRQTFNASYSNVATVTVFVDNAAGVVQLQPGEEAVITEGAGNQWARSLSTEGTG
jgi:biotin carboxyl carrier protein